MKEKAFAKAADFEKMAALAKETKDEFMQATFLGGLHHPSIILAALDSYAREQQKKADKIKAALTAGSEDGNLDSHSEREILDGCVALMGRVVSSVQEWAEFVGINASELEEEEQFSFSMSWDEIVQRLFLFGTTHSGGTSTGAKCRQLGVADLPSPCLEFDTDDEDEEDR